MDFSGTGALGGLAVFLSGVLSVHLSARTPGRVVRLVRRTPRRRPGTLKLKDLDRAASPGKIPIQLLWRFLLLLGVPGVLAFHPLGSRRLSTKLCLK